MQNRAVDTKNRQEDGSYCPEKNIRVKLKLLRELPPVNIDEARVEQVFENIISNALKFTAERDTVTIRTCFDRENEKFVQVSIADTGSGIHAKDLEKIFDKFQRIENGIETVRGTGLGLSIAKHVISSHGGQIWVESKEGEGSTFSLRCLHPRSVPTSCRLCSADQEAADNDIAGKSPRQHGRR